VRAVIRAVSRALAASTLGAVVAMAAGCEGMVVGPDGGVAAREGAGDGSTSSGFVPTSGAGRLVVSWAGQHATGSATWTLVDATGATIATGVGDLGTSLTISPVRAGSGYELSVATPSDAGAGCSGHVTGIDVPSGTTVAVSLPLVCTAPTPTIPNPPCGTLESILAPSTSAVLGGSLTMAAYALGADPTAVTFAWLVQQPGVGHIESMAPPVSGRPIIGTAVFVCDSIGVTSITVFALDGTADPNLCERDSQSWLQVAVQCDEPDAGAQAIDAAFSATDATADDAAVAVEDAAAE
jgi:hypothetical protein